MILIDLRVTPYSPRDEIVRQLKRLLRLPQDDKNVRDAVETVRSWLIS